MDPDGCVAWCDSATFRQFIEASLFEIDDLQCLAIFSLERHQERRDAAADVAFGTGVRLLVSDDFSGPTFQCPVRGRTLPVMIDYSVAQDTVKPCNDAFLVSNLGTAFEAADKSGLKDVFGDSARLYAGFDKGQETAVAVYQNLDGV
jgi:hypothetical protein